MKHLINNIRLIESFSSSMTGIFSTADLKNLFNESSGLRLNRHIVNLIEAGIISRYSRGLYVTKAATLEALSARMQEKSYLSLATALARHLMIGTQPSRTVFAVKPGRPMTFSGPTGRIEYAGSLPELIFGFETIDGINFATPEKALIDTLYYHQKGRRYYFDIFSDVDISRVDPAAVHTYLEHYRNPRFVAFVKGYLDGGIR